MSQTRQRNGILLRCAERSVQGASAACTAEENATNISDSVCFQLYGIIDLLIITDRNQSLGQGNVFTLVCHSVHRRGGDLPDRDPPAPVR